MLNKAWVKLSIVVFVIITAGCTSVDPYTGEQRTSRSTYGSGMGAAGGAAVGALVAGKGDRTEGALIGAAAGALIGGGIGHHMDMQSQALHNDLRRSNIHASRNGDVIELDHGQSIFFEKNSSIVHAEFKQSLMDLVRVLNKPDFRNTNVMVDGHAEGYENTPEKLALDRAERVADFLVGRGIGTHRIVVNAIKGGYSSKYGDPRGNRKVSLRISPLYNQ